MGRLGEIAKAQRDVEHGGKPRALVARTPDGRYASHANDVVHIRYEASTRGSKLRRFTGVGKAFALPTTRAVGQTASAAAAASSKQRTLGNIARMKVTSVPKQGPTTRFTAARTQGRGDQWGEAGRIGRRLGL